MIKKIFQDWVSRYFSDPQMVILSFLLIFGFIVIYMLGDFLAPALISIVIAYILEGLVSFLEKLKLPRLASVLIVFILFIACVLVLLIWLLPTLSGQVAQFFQQIPDIIASGQKELLMLPQKYPDYISEEHIKQVMGVLGSTITNFGQRIVSLSLASVRGLIDLLVYLVIVPFLIFFFLKDKDLIINWISALLPENRGLATSVWKEVNEQLINYIRGKMWEFLLVWVVTYATFVYFKLQFAMLLAFFIGIAVIIPYVGAMITFFPVAMIGYFQWGLGSDFAYVMISLCIIHALDGNLLAPLLLSEVVNIHPVAVILALLVFGGLWGVWGMFFAIPLATLVHALIKAWTKQGNDSEIEFKDEITRLPV